MSIGLKKDTVVLEPHQEEWDIEGGNTCKKIKRILGDDIVDVQHVGSTSIKSICAKPIIDIAVAVKSFQDIMKHNEELSNNGIVYRKQDIPGQHLYRSGDLEHDIVTHFIHVVIYDCEAWHNYLNFRDYMNAHPEDAKAYDQLKRKLCSKYPGDRDLYLEGKKELITELLSKARQWREQ
ncbi:GrpB domain, predicted nucleotidyltransferase, UPF0157 family [Lachnospiraceae bacterium NE2001]|nr:GrpB domain, predicted nucleotidyltransferase, UPF0157 family [Lachnospiraceae bacterium NE2001]